MSEDELRRRISEAAWIYTDPATHRLRVEECAAFYQRMAVELGVGWAAVRLRIPPEYRPTAVEEEAYRRVRDLQQPGTQCMGCGRPGCQGCARLERELGVFTDAELLEAMRHATNVGGLSYLDLQHEMWRRRSLPSSD